MNVENPGELTGTPQYVRVIALGKCMILDADRQRVYTPPDGSLLVSDFKRAQKILAHFGYECDESIAVEQGLFYVRKAEVATPLFEEPADEEAERDLRELIDEDRRARRHGPALSPVVLAPDPLPPDAAVAVPLIAAALPCGTDGDQIDTNRLHLAWAAWKWMLGHADALRPVLYPEPPPPPAKAAGVPVPPRSGRTKAAKTRR